MMSIFRNFKFDLITYLLGIASGVLLTWIVNRIIRSLPNLKEPLDKQSEVIRMGNLEGMNKYMQQTMLVKSQHMHLAHELFPLEEILIPPRLIASPYTNPSSEHSGIETIASEIIPFLADCTEFSSTYPSNDITLEQAIQNGVNVVITGQPGSGKSIALADLAAKIVKSDPSVKRLWKTFPVLVHVSDIDLTSKKFNDPLDRIVETISENISNLFRRRLPRFMKFMAYHGRLLILVDGLDELPLPALDSAVKYLYTLTKRYPKARIITTSTPEFMDGLTNIGFYPLQITSWNLQTINLFLEKWISAWNKFLAPAINPQTHPVFEQDMLIPWLTSDYPVLTPMEWTLRIWSSLAGDSRGSSSVDHLEAYIQRITASKIPHQKIEGLALHYLLNDLESIPSNQVERTLAKVKISSKAAGLEITPPDETAQDVPQIQPSKKRKQRTVVNRSAIYDRLLSSGILVENVRFQTRFAHPVVTGYMASFGLDNDTIPANLVTETRWCVQNISLRFYTAREKTLSWSSELLKEDDPLYRRTMTICRWLPDIPVDFPTRNQILRHIAGLIQNTSIPLYIQARILTTFLASNDPSRITLLKQLLTSHSPTTRFLTALGCGVIGDPRILQDLMNLFHDPDYFVRQAACLAVAQLDLPDMADRLKDIMLNADEDMRRAAAESIAVMSTDNHEILQELVTSDDLLARRASVFGLSLIRKKWVIELLEKIAVEDGQWVVRNAASQALDAMQNPHMTAPVHLVKATEAPWLIAFAARNGMGVSPNLPPVDILLLALTAGNQEEKLSALTYLRLYNQNEVVSGIYKMVMKEKDPYIATAGYYALWFMGASGVHLKPVSQYTGVPV